MSFADLLQLVGATCSKPANNKFSQSTCNKSVDNLQQTFISNNLSRAIRMHPDNKSFARCHQTCFDYAFLAV